MTFKTAIQSYIQKSKEHVTSTSELHKQTPFNP